MEDKEMTRTYQVKYKSKSKMLTTPEKVEDTKKTILEVPRVKSVEIKDDGQIVSIEVEKEEDFEEVARIIAYRLKNEETDEIKEECLKRVAKLTEKVTMYSNFKYI